MPLPTGFDTKRFLQQLDKTRDLVGAKVVYFDGAVMSTLRAGPPMSQTDLMAVVIRKGGKELLPTSAEIQQAKDKHFHAELLNLGLSCGGAVLAWVTTVVSGAAAPVTGGTSLIITKISAVAGYVGTAQCVIAAGRVAAEMYDPEINIDLDNNEYYQIVSTAMDAIGLAGAAISFGGTAKMVLMLRRSTGKSMVDVIKGLSGVERKRLTQQIFRSQDPELSKTKLKLKMLAGRTPGALKPGMFNNKGFTQTAIAAGLRQQLLDAVGATGNTAGSATSGIIGQAVSGPEEDYIVGLVHAYETE
jgi:hypothetical protein